MSHIFKVVNVMLFCAAILFGFPPQRCFSTEISIQDQTIVISNPEGYVGVSGRIQWYFDYIERQIHSAKLFEVYVSKEDFENLLAGKNFTPSRYFTLRANKKLLDLQLKSSQFNKIKYQFKQLSINSDKKSEKDIEDLIRRTPEYKIKVKPTEIVFSEGIFTVEGITEEGANYMLPDVIVEQLNDGDGQFLMAQADALTFIKSHMLTLAATSRLTSKEELKWVRSAVLKWAKETVKK